MTIKPHSVRFFSLTPSPYKYLGDNLDAIPGSKVIQDRIGVLYEKQGNRKPKTPPTGGNP